jgi:hypothetical protein
VTREVQIRKRSEDAASAGFEGGGGAKSLGMLVASRSYKRQENSFCLRAPEGMQLC